MRHREEDDATIRLFLRRLAVMEVIRYQFEWMAVFPRARPEWDNCDRKLQQTAIRLEKVLVR
jgi:hypothetical protein